MGTRHDTRSAGRDPLSGFGNIINRASGQMRVNIPRKASPLPEPHNAPTPTATPPATAQDRTITRSPPILGPHHVSELMSQADRAPERSREGGNLDGYLHLSSLIGACPRHHCISRQHGLPTSSPPLGAMRVVWAIGRAVEKHAREGIIRAQAHEDVYGRWVCPCNSDGYTGRFEHERFCHVCKRPTSLYREPVLRNDVHRVVGSPDLTLLIMGWFLVIEFKSMNKEQFDDLEEPLADHIQQACGYHWLYQQLGFPVLPEVRVVYIRKDFAFGGRPGTEKSIYKEYRVRASEYEYQIERMMAMALDIHAHNEEQTLPPRVCGSDVMTRAKGCSRRVLCFGMD